VCDAATTPKETWGETKSILQSRLPFSRNWKTDNNATQLTAIICSAPVWNSSEFINQTITKDQIDEFVEKGISGNT
jgi:hypothetical protein